MCFDFATGRHYLFKLYEYSLMVLKAYLLKIYMCLTG